MSIYRSLVEHGKTQKKGLWIKILERQQDETKKNIVLVISQISNEKPPNYYYLLLPITY